jgi:ribosome-binding factor A
MTSRRVQKAAQAIRQVVSMAILTEIKDPRVQDVTVTYVELTPDMRQAKVHVSVMGDETRQRLSLAGLKSAAGFLQAKVADRIDTRYTPRIEFYLDQGVKKSIEVARILKRVLPPAEAAQGDDLADGAEDESGTAEAPLDDSFLPDADGTPEADLPPDERSPPD